MEIHRLTATATYAVVPLIDAASRPNYKASPTIASGDVKIIRHTGGAWDYSNIDTGGTLPAIIGGSATKQVLVTLTATQMTSDNLDYPIIVQFVDQTATKEWDDQTIVIWTKPKPSNMTQIDGQATSGNNASLKLKTLDIQNSAGVAVNLAAGGGNYDAVSAVGSGNRHGMVLQGGASAGSAGLFISSQANNYALRIYGGGGTYQAVSIENGSGDAISVTGYNALQLTGSLYAGLKITGGSGGNDLNHAVILTGGTGSGGDVNGGDGIKITGGAPGGDANAGHGANITGGTTAGVGSFGDAIKVTATGNGYGARIAAGSNQGIGVSISGNEVGMQISGYTALQCSGSWYYGINAVGGSAGGAGYAGIRAVGGNAIGGDTDGGAGILLVGGNYAGTGNGGPGISSTGGNGPSATKGGAGFKILGGNYGVGIAVDGGSNSSAATFTAGSSASYTFSITGGAVSSLLVSGSGNGKAATFTGSGSGVAIDITGGATAGAIAITAGGGNTYAATFTGMGTGGAFSLQSGTGADAKAVYIKSNAASGSGNAIHAEGAYMGSAIYCLAGQNGGVGMYLDAGAAGYVALQMFGGSSPTAYNHAVSIRGGTPSSGDNAGGHAMYIVAGTGSGAGANGRGIYAPEIGATFSIDGVTGAGILDVMKKFADDNGGADFDATSDSLHAISGGGDSSALYVRQDTCQAGSASGTAVLDAAASASDDFYNDCTIWIYDGTGEDQVRYIQDYTGATKTCSIAPNWIQTPDATSKFRIMPGARTLKAKLAELAVAQPAAEPSVEDAIMFRYMYQRNKATEDGSLVSVYNDAGNVIAKATTTEAGGIFTKDKFVAGT